MHPNSVLHRSSSSSGHRCKNTSKLTPIKYKTHRLLKTRTAIHNCTLQVMAGGSLHRFGSVVSDGTAQATRLLALLFPHACDAPKAKHIRRTLDNRKSTIVRSVQQRNVAGSRSTTTANRRSKEEGPVVIMTINSLFVSIACL
jgi:hypothetical protein